MHSRKCRKEYQMCKANKERNEIDKYIDKVMKKFNIDEQYIKKLLESYTITEILEWRKDSRWNIKPKELITYNPNY